MTSGLGFLLALGVSGHLRNSHESESCTAVSDSVIPPGSCPWNSPAQCTGVVSHFLLHFLLHIRVSYFVFYLPIFIKQHFTISTPENLIHLLPHTARSVFFDISCWTQVLKEQNPLCFRDGIGELRKILLLRKSSSSNHLIGGAIKLSPFL